tara:strand:+ start:4474 stop:4818 length:345 start_codon:yes stop_codon:yes gene_type:complete
MIDTEKYEGHTPAPWTVYTEEGRDAIYSVDNRAVCDKDGKTIAIIECPYCKEDEHLSYNNKILIADAPLILAEVKRLREGINFALSYTRPTPHTDDPWMACREFIVEYLKELIE